MSTNLSESTAAERPRAKYRADVMAVMRVADDLRRQLSQAIEHIWRARDLTERRLMILDAVYRGIDRPGRLIEAFDVLPSTITFETDKLVAAGLLAREPLPSERRVVHLSLTPEGERLQRELIDTLNSFVAERLAALKPSELEAFLSIGAKILRSEECVKAANRSR